MYEKLATWEKSLLDLAGFEPSEISKTYLNGFVENSEFEWQYKACSFRIPEIRKWQCQIGLWLWVLIDAHIDCQ